jgi:hypothetical protein
MEIVADWSRASLNGRVAAGFFGFIALALFGLQLFVRGIRDDIYDWLGHAPASRAWFIVGGIFLQLPLVAWIAFLIHQGWFQQLSTP